MNRVQFAAAVFALASAATPAAAADFTGPRAEGRLGWTDVSTDEVDDDGLTYGVGIGYDYTFGQSIVVGAEANFDWIDVDGCATRAGGVLACFDTKRDISVAVRAGYKVLENTLVYAKGGYANGRVRGEFTQGGTTTGDTQNGDGFVVGGGAEQALGPNLYAKLEYAYSNYEAGVDRHQILLGVGFRFSGLGF
ncbi:outer membrane protein [Pedomonas mirosovicensis]|uniref:outer membrane protein n=1 Tax=Pedomonas mirosovicensis TaxID=2908641 RepID=UPI00216A9915|nr:porin family protein [Pedomonas mirosovicensis]MCH8685695.1 porin family protein [Pedomonas mirosovicensis]